MANPRLARIRELAEKATPGPWVQASWQNTAIITQRWADESTPPEERGRFLHVSTTSDLDAAFIAAADPSVVLALVDLVEQQHAALEAASAVRIGLPIETRALHAYEWFGEVPDA